MRRTRRESPPAEETVRRPRRGRCCLTGCLGIVVFVALSFTIAYNTTSRYQPNVPAPPPLPVPNALDDYIAAGVLFDLNGGDKPMNDPRGFPELLDESSVVQANQPPPARTR